MSVGTKAWNRKMAQAAHDKRAAVRGCTLDQYVELRSMGKTGHSPVAAFLKQRRNAAKRGIGWQLTLWEWWSIWQESAHWGDRGRQVGNFVMARHGDVGPYAVGNVSIVTTSQNLSEANLGVSRTRKAA